ncbi:nuclear envelope pore membrane protein POM 121C isoform X2 [Lutra lutra]|uniref:nuclear envelope pore membrane protein POM 121C isoform X2 n=1 Tax=Lutra lutra TaxID=9657 RepID=UPI001FD220AA|nr:nuclear envelope pore membrane protein POM 121C isoform X2 [Lutra lutra]
MSPAAAAAGGGERRRPIASVRDGRGRGGGCGGRGGAALLGLSLFGLVLYLVPAAAALAWLAVGATAAWWGLSREPRGSRALSSLVRNARRQRTLHASPPAKSAVNGNLLEPRTLLEGPDPAELLLMGSYLGKPGPPQPAPAPEARDLLERPGRRRTPARAAPPAHSAHRVHHIHPSLPTPLLRSSRRPSHRDCGTLSNRFMITPRRRYPIQQAQYSLLGVLPTVCWNGYHKKTVLSARNSKMVCSPVTVRIAPPDSKWTRSPLPEQTINSTLSSPSSNAPDPCAKETVLSALKERKKRTVEEEDQIFSDSQENKRRRHDSSGSGHSAFEPLVANGVPASFVPKPGSLKRGLNSQSSDDHLNKRSRTSSVSSLTSTYTGGIPSSSRNAITSSYSSTRGFSQLWKRTGPSSSPLSSPASSRSQTPERPAKKIREDELSHRSSSSTPLAADKEAQGERESTAAAATAAPSPPKTPSLLAPLGSPQSGPLPGTSSEAKSAANFLGLTPAASQIPATNTTVSSLAPQAEKSSMSPAPAAPSPTPKPSLLLGMLSAAPADPPVSTAPSVSSASPMFKPIFMVPPKSENEDPLLSSPSKVATTAPSGSALPAPASSPQPMFKPIFGSMGSPTSAPLSAPFSFSQTAAPATAGNVPLFAGQAGATSAAAPTSTASTSADSTSKPVFSFGVSSVTSTTTSAAPPFLFGAPPASGASFTPAAGSIFQFGKPPTTPASTAVTTFGQSLPGAVRTAATSSGGGAPCLSGFGGGLSTPAPATGSPPAPTFTTAAAAAPAFHIPFGSSAKPTLPSYPGAHPQPAFGAADGQPQGAAKPALGPGFGSSFTFGNSTAATPAPGPAQPAFGGAAPSSFGSLKPASAFGTPAGTQPAFGSGAPVFSFGAATTSGFGAATQTTSSGTGSSVFGGATPSPFTFGGSAGPAGSGGFGIHVATPGTSGAFSFGTGQSGTTSSTTPFGGGLSQSTLGGSSQSTPFAFNVGSTPESKPVFGGTSTPTFGQNTPASGVGTSGSGLSFGASSTPSQGFVGVVPFGSAAPSFSIGAGSKTPGARQRLQARRQHTRKK